MSSIDVVVERSRSYAERTAATGWTGGPTRLRLAVVACMDPRIQVAELLGLEQGDAHTIRNAGGIVTDDAVRSLIVSCHLAETREVMIINHTRCAMQAVTEDQLASALNRPGAASAGPVSFHTFTDLEENVRRQIEVVRSHALMPEDIVVRGFIYDVDTSRLSEVGAA